MWNSRLSVILLSVLITLAVACQNPGPADEGSKTEAAETEGLSYRGSVTDLEGILTDVQESVLKEKIREVEEQQSIEVAIISVKDIPDSTDVLQYATELGNRWEIGGDEGNAVVVLLSTSEGQVGIAVGRKLENRYPDEVTGRIISKEMLPFFRTKYYQQGLMNMLEALEKVQDTTASKK